MRLWQKIFLCSFLLFELVFNATILYLIQVNFNSNLEKEIDRGLSDHFVIFSGLKTNGTFFKDKFGYSNEIVTDFLKIAVRDYTQYFENKGVFIEVLDKNNQQVYSSFNLNYGIQREELKVPLSENRKYVIRDIGKNSYLFVINQLNIEDQSFKLTYIRDISDVYYSRSMLFNAFIKLNIFVFIFLAAGLYFLLWHITSPVRQLTESARSIASGDYSKRAGIKSHDEIGVLAAAFDQMAASVESKVEELKRNAETKQSFIQYLTHELKTPLTSIIGYADLLQTTKYNEEQFHKGLNYIYKEGKRLERLSFKLMDLILLEKKEAGMKNTDLSILCCEVLETMKPRLESKSIRIVPEIHPDKAMVECDLFKVLITNLIDNAINASENGSCIYLRTYIGPEENIVIEIEDKGAGIPEKDIDRVFEPFFSVNRSRSESRRGTGLGLALCAEIVKLHHGKIEISSRINERTKVKITFPKFATNLQLTDTFETLQI